MAKNNKLSAIGLLLALVMVLGLVLPVAAQDEVVTIEWMQWWAGSAQEGAIDALIAEFEAEYPNINVEPINLPFGEVRNQVILNAAAGQLPDVIGMNPPWMAEFVELGVLEPLEGYIAADENFAGDALVQAPMAAFEGSTWMVPATSSTFVLYYNKTLFEQAGLEGVPADWEELRAYASQCTDSENDIYGFSMFMNEQPPANGSIVITYPLIYAAGGRTIVDDVPAMTDPAVTDALQLLKDLHDDGSVIPGTTSKLEVQMVEEFSTGNICMMVENTAHIGTLANRNPDLDYGLMPIPPKDAETDAVLRSHGWELGMSVSSDNKEEAWTFMSWLTSEAPNAMLAELSANIPGNTQADVSFYADTPQLIEAIDIIAENVMVEELMVTPQATNRWQAFTRETIKLLLGDQSVEDVVTNTQAEWDQIGG